ncbi:MAG TPA: hypothetical protein EYQ69_01950, partial [Gemmatimonadetes bacterium]|nr:hypothetical protein [Gemmatimonadota bacterium]
MMTDIRMLPRWVPIVLLMVASFGSTSSGLEGQDVVQQEITRLMSQQLTQEEIVSRISSLGLSRADLRGRLEGLGYGQMVPTMNAYFDRIEGATNPQSVTDN